MAQLKNSPQSGQRTEAESIPPEPGVGDHPIHDPPAADWREPLDDLEEEENEGGQGLHVGQQDKAHTGSDVLKRIRQDGLSVSRKKRYKESDELWTDWPILGKGWKRRVYYSNSGTREDTYYMSPDGERLRSKVDLRRHLPNTDLSCFQYKSGLFSESTTTKLSNGVNNTENGVTSGGTTLFERPSTPTGKPGRPQSVTPPEGANTSTPKHETPQSFSQSCVTTTPRPHPKPDTDHPKTSSNFGSPPRLAPISPPVRQPDRSPSLHLGDLSPAPSPSKLVSATLIAQAWLQSSQNPVSPMRSTRSKSRPTPPNGAPPVMVKAPPSFPSPPALQRTMDTRRLLTAKKPSVANTVIRDCAGCGCTIAAVDDEEFCGSCITLQKLTVPKQNIVFKKVGQGQWVLANPTIQNEEQKANTTEHEKKSLSLRPQKPLNVKTTPTVQRQNSDTDEEYTAKTNTKKRQRRMCFKCEACLRKDCGKCDYCKDKPKFGGRNTKKQKCRLRWCIYEKRKYKMPSLKAYKQKQPFVQRVKPTRPRSKRPHKRPAWEEDYTDPEDEEEKKRRQRDGVDRDAEAEGGDEDDEDYHFELEQDDDDKDMANEYTEFNTKEPSLHTFPVILQNGGLQMNSSYLQTNGSQGPVMLYSFMSPPAGGNVVLSKDVQMLAMNMNAPMEEDSLDFPPTISEMFSLADGSQPPEGSGEAELRELLVGLRCTVLPAHWMAVLAQGPALQLLQCSRRSPMADTLLQIQPGFRFGLSVRGLPLPPAHPLYERHPPRLTCVSQVVELLLDLEGLEVCQGYPWGSALAVKPRTDQAVLCIRAAACHLLVDPEEEGERCDRCHPPSSDA